jgi:hypothetical protein
MFLRRFQERKNGKSHVYWPLVETYRTAKGPRQRIVSYLSELQESEQIGWAQMSANHLSQPPLSTQSVSLLRIEVYLWET